MFVFGSFWWTGNLFHQNMCFYSTCFYNTQTQFFLANIALINFCILQVFIKGMKMYGHKEKTESSLTTDQAYLRKYKVSQRIFNTLSTFQEHFKSQHENPRYKCKIYYKLFDFRCFRFHHLKKQCLSYISIKVSTRQKYFQRYFRNSTGRHL